MMGIGFTASAKRTCECFGYAIRMMARSGNPGVAMTGTSWLTGKMAADRWELGLLREGLT